MKTNQMPNHLGFLTGICLSLTAALAPLATGASQKIVSNGDHTKSGQEITFSQYSDVVPTPRGDLTIMSTGGIAYSCAPGNLLTKVKNGGPISDGLVLEEIDDNGSSISPSGAVVFYSTVRTTGGLSRPAGLFVSSGGKVVQIAQQGANAPGGGRFDFGPGGIARNSTETRISNNGRYVAFRSLLTSGPDDGIYLADTAVTPAKLTKVMAAGDAAPNGGQFVGFNDVYRDFAVINSGKVVFGASTTLHGMYFNPLYVRAGGNVASIPDSEGITFFQINDREDLLLGGESQLRLGSISGVSVLFDRGDAAVGGGTYFRFENPLLDAAGNIAFAADLSSTSAESGVFLRTVDGAVTKIMLNTDTVPGGGVFYGRDYGFPYPVAIHGSMVFFRAPTGSGVGGIFGGNGQQLTKILRAGDMIDGRIVTDVSGYVFNERNTEGQLGFNKNGQFVYYARFNSGGALFVHPYVAKPEIEVKVDGKNLVDAKGFKSFGSVVAGDTGKAVIFTVKNVGTAKLKNLGVSLSGKNPSDFKLVPFKSSSLGSGSKTTFKVYFRPAKKGDKTAILRINSNDKDESPFDVALKGAGLP